MNGMFGPYIEKWMRFITVKNMLLLAVTSAIIADIGLYILTLIFPKSPFFKTFIYGLYIVLIIIGIVKANKDEDPELPVVGNIAKSIFGKKIDE